MDTAEDRLDEIYAPPKAQLESAGDYYVFGKYLVAQSPLELPRRCVKTNASDTEDSSIAMLRRSFADVNPWTVRLVRRRCQISYGLSPAVYRELAAGLVLARIAMAAGLFLLAVGIFISDGLDFYFCLLGLLTALFGAIAASRCIPLQVSKSSGRWFFIKGCSPEFLHSIQSEQAAAGIAKPEQAP